MLTHTLRTVHQIMKGYISRPTVSPEKAIVIPFRCWPIDCDIYFHMNNSKYLATAELARWRTLPPSDMLSRTLSKEGLLFIAAENKVKYIRPINPMQKYVISTTVTVDSEDKWFYYKHSFLEHPDDAKGKQNSFAIVDLKAVVKKKNGKTIKPSVLIEDSKFYQEWVTKKPE